MYQHVALDEFLLSQRTFFAASLFRFGSNVARPWLDGMYRDSGFAVEAIVKTAMKMEGTYHDAFRMSLLCVQMPPDLPPGVGTEDKKHF
jgi:hypothetical protein